MADTLFGGVGRRKTSVARVWLKTGKGEVLINNRKLNDYFPCEMWQAKVKEPLELTKTKSKYSVVVNVKGGGVTGQAEAIRHGISRVLVKSDETLRKKLKAAGFLKRDPRMVESKNTVKEKQEEDNSSQRGNFFLSKLSQRSKSGSKIEITPPSGRLGVLLPGMSGAVSTTFIAGVEAINKGIGKPIGSLTQMGTIRLGKRTQKKAPLIKKFIPLANCKDIVFSGWDIFSDNCYDACLKSGVLNKELLDKLKRSLTKISPMKAVFDQQYVKNLSGKHIKKGKTKMDFAQQLIEDINKFKKQNKIDRLVMIWCGSTEVFIKPKKVHKTLKDFEKGLKQNDKNIPPSMIYAYAAIKCGVPYANGAPNLSADVPALEHLAKENEVPIAGKDFKTGQTLMKTILAPGFKSRMLGINGWFSTNILGNRDGEVLDDPWSFKTKEESKLGVLDSIFQPHLYPELYSNLYHKVRINYYPPRGDAKEAWDNIDIFGWLNYPMQIKVNFLCRDSILAAPIVLDLVIFLDLAQRAGMYGIQEWLSFYFKSPMVDEALYPEHDLFIQLMKLKNTLRHLMGEELITHLGLDYYDLM